MFHFSAGIRLAAFFIFISSFRVTAVEPPVAAPPDWLPAATNHIGQWIWDTNSLDKQTCRFWKSFEVPAGKKVSRALLHITVDNGYTLYFDGQEIGRGSDWRTVTEYDVTWLLAPGRHVLAVEGFNDRLQAGLIFGLQMQFGDGTQLEIDSDDSWFVVPLKQRGWAGRKNISTGWRHAVVVGSMHDHPWETWPYGLAVEPALRPIILHFWQRGWFQLGMFMIALAAFSACLWLMTQLASQSKAQKFLQVERARIARDIHDDLGAQLTQLVLLGEVAQREQPENSAVQNQFREISARARELSQAMDEVVWAVNSRRDTVRDFVSYVCKHAQLFLNDTRIRCRLDVAEVPDSEFDLPVRRNLFLAVKEALNNAAKYSQANELFLRLFCDGKNFIVMVEDDGRGFDPAQAGTERNGLSNMSQRMAEIGGGFNVASQPGGGCRITFSVPLKPAQSGKWLGRRDDPSLKKIELPVAGDVANG